MLTGALIICYVISLYNCVPLKINGDQNSSIVILRNLKTVDTLNTSSTDHCVRAPVKDEEDERRRKKRSDGSTSRDDDESDTLSTNEIDVYNDFLKNYSKEIAECELWAVEPGCFILYSNNTAYIPIYNRYYEKGNYIMINEELNVCSKSLTTSRPTEYSSVFSTFTTIGLSISIICMILHIITFILIPTLRNLPGYCLVSLCVSLIIGYICMLVVPLFEVHEDCFHLGMMMFYFYLASFFWMNILSYDVFRSLRIATSKLRLTTRIWLRFAAYSAYSWGAPALLILSIVIIDRLGDVSDNYKLLFTNECWFSFKEASLLYFGTPFFILFLLNVIFFVWSFIMITSASMKTVENRDMLWTKFCIIFRLAVIMGLTWFFGVIAIIANIGFLWYFFLIFNTSQGVFIFFSFSCGPKTRNAWKLRIQKRNNSMTPTIQSSFHSQHMTSTI